MEVLKNSCVVLTSYTSSFQLATVLLPEDENFLLLFRRETPLDNSVEFMRVRTKKWGHSGSDVKWGHSSELFTLYRTFHLTWTDFSEKGTHFWCLVPPSYKRDITCVVCWCRSGETMTLTAAATSQRLSSRWRSEKKFLTHTHGLAGAVHDPWLIFVFFSGLPSRPLPPTQEVHQPWQTGGVHWHHGNSCSDISCWPLTHCFWHGFSSQMQMFNKNKDGRLDLNDLARWCWSCDQQETHYIISFQVFYCQICIYCLSCSPKNFGPERKLLAEV